MLHSDRGPLSGLNVLELGEWIAAPYAGKLLGDLGAHVLKVEWGVGDATRRWGPFPPGSDGDPERSGLFSYLNTSKESWHVPASVDPAELQREVIARGSGLDVVIIDQHFLARLPAGAVEALTTSCPTTIVATISPFGLAGPRGGYRAYDIVCSASSGLAYGVGDRDRAPLPIPMSQGEHQAGLAAGIAILMAVQARDLDGLGQHVDVSVTEALACLHTAFFLPLYVYAGGIPGCRNGREGGLPTYPNTVLPCQDGLVAVNSPQVAQWIRFLQLLGNPAWADEPRFRDRRAMASQYKDEVDALVVDGLASWTKADLYQEFIARRIPCAPIFNGADLLANEHLESRRAIATLRFSGGGQFVAPGLPYHFSRSRAEPTAPPRLGDCRERPTSPPSPAALAQLPAIAGGPLRGIRVLDLGTAWAGGLAGRFMGDFGADVIKVESWTHMDGSRMGRPLLGGDFAGGDAGLWPDIQPGFHVHGRSKRSVALNLKTHGGREVLMQMASSADVVLHNFSAGVMERLDLAPEKLLETNPGLIVAGQCVAGQSGPAKGYIGYAGSVAALSGLGSAVGYEGEEPIGMFQGLHSDVVSALTTVFATLAALRERSVSGHGQAIEVSQWEATMSMAEELLMTTSITGRELGSAGFGHPLLYPHGTYPCNVAPDDDPASAWIAIAVGSDEEWRALLRVIDTGGALPMGAPDWSADERRAQGTIIESAVAAWTQTQDRYEAERRLQSSGVAAAAVQSVADMLSDPQLAFRQSFVYLNHPLVGAEPMPGLPWKLSRTPGDVSVPAPSLGEHTREVLLGELGLSDTQYSALVAEGAVEIGPVSNAVRTAPR
jgi:crotonobetainyl-CoA:carnitine CoA-transferase CaiB-like acyl-CoA transferase